MQKQNSCNDNFKENILAMAFLSFCGCGSVTVHSQNEQKVLVLDTKGKLLENFYLHLPTIQSICLCAMVS